MKVDLSKCSWEMRGYWPNTPLFESGTDIGAAKGAVTHWMPARIPGCVMNDLIENGVIEDPYYEMNSLGCEWVENRWWVYCSEFDADKSWRDQDIDLVFSGIDYKCHIFLNNEKLCGHEGMFEPIRIDITDKICYDSANILKVVLENAPDVTGQIGYTSKTNTQTSRFGYKWDFSTRQAHTGIWQEVYIEITPGARIKNTHVMTSLNDDKGIVDIKLQMKAAERQSYRISARLSWEDTVAVQQAVDIRNDGQPVLLRMEVDSPKLWWPNGYGSQPLYELTVELWREDVLCDQYSTFVGIRSLAYRRNGKTADALPYVIKINGRDIYIKGANISPLDHCIGSVGYDRYESLIGQVKAANANLIRVWGGGITEKEDFYNICDRMGILVWQEFNQSSSGIDNIPSKDTQYLELLRKNAVASILARRNHVCLVVWSGGNELMDENGIPSTYEDANIGMLKTLVKEHDCRRLFLPTSASGPSESLDVSKERKGINHDVHGPWQYQGPVKHYEVYNNSDSLLHSEFGVDAFTNYNAAVRFLSGRNLKPSNVGENLVWRHHGEWWDTTERDRALFGELKSLKAMISCSQYVQAEGLRYAVESNRRRAFHNSGSIIWQLNEPWPNLFCTCLIDYYGQPKAAYWWIKRAYAPLAASLRYDKLIYEPGSVFSGDIWLSDDNCKFNGDVDYRVKDMLGKVHYQGSCRVDLCGSHSAQAGSAEFIANGFPYGFFIVELEIGGEGAGGPNQYMFSCSKEPAFAPLLCDCICTEVEIKAADGGIIAENKGDVAAVNVNISCGKGSDICKDNCFILWPKQVRYFGCGEGKDMDAVSGHWLNDGK